MPSLEGFEYLKEKVPDLKTSRGKILSGVYILGIFGGCLLFFFWMGGLIWYGSLVGQLIIAFIGTVISAVHFRVPSKYREKYGALAYRYYFYHFVIPILATWYACCFHPIFIGGPQILPFWVAIFIGILLLVMGGLTEVQIEKSGFDVTTHGMDIFTIFPEETEPVHGEIYSFIRHPLYFALICISLSFAFFRNSLMAILASLIFLIPMLIAIYQEDRELVERYGEVHQEYIKKTGALLPTKRPLGFLKILFSRKKTS
ncbi:MAG: isoprenylcysteine carboxylmethyltransferase family protein [Candidatus Thorarchaeota archaeon]|jgi:protein-S-isoprenylcysteine O-methyltransferase Ste14